MEVCVVSDIHYAGPAEQARRGFESAAIRNPALRLLARGYRHWIWLRDPFAHNALLDAFVARTRTADFVVANGDYSCDSGYVGLSDDAACAGATIVLERLRAAFGSRCQTVIGDHELGKMSLFGGLGGLRLASWERCAALGLEPFWQHRFGRYVLMGITSSLIALPVFVPETLPVERPQWVSLREQHLAQVNAAFGALADHDRVLLFCHDPTALPFLWESESVRKRLSQIECTIIGHLHSPLVLWKSRVLSGIPAIAGFGNTIRRYSTALNRARHWLPFQVRLCPSLAGIELLKDGGFLRLRFDPDGHGPVEVTTCRLARSAN